MNEGVVHPLEQCAIGCGAVWREDAANSAHW
jgi:hypothetical protein